MILNTQALFRPFVTSTEAQHAANLKTAPTILSFLLIMLLLESEDLFTVPKLLQAPRICW